MGRGVGLHRGVAGHGAERARDKIVAAEIEGAAMVRVSVFARRARGAGSGGGEIAAGDRRRQRVGIAEAAEAVERRQGRQVRRGIAAGDAFAQQRDALHHVDEEARQREARPFGVGGGVEEHQPAGAAGVRPSPGACRRRASPTSCRRARAKVRRAPGVRCERRRGRERPANGERSGKGPRGARGFPGEGAAEGASAAGAQAHRREGVYAFGDPRPGETHQHPARFDPAREARRGVAGEPPQIGEGDDRKVAVDGRVETDAADIAGRGERAFEVVKVRQQRLAGFEAAAGHQAHGGGGGSVRRGTRLRRRCPVLRRRDGRSRCASPGGCRGLARQWRRPPRNRLSVG